MGDEKETSPPPSASLLWALQEGRSPSSIIPTASDPDSSGERSLSLCRLPPARSLPVSVRGQSDVARLRRVPGQGLAQVETAAQQHDDERLLRLRQPLRHRVLARPDGGGVEQLAAQPARLGRLQRLGIVQGANFYQPL